jgi:ligand-binding sensor domain-containing protein
VKKTIYIIALSLFSTQLNAQSLYPEKFEDCKLSQFCLDCGNPQAQPPKTVFQNILRGIGEKNLTTLKGTIEMQIVVDQEGKPCLLSIDNKTNLGSAELGIKQSVNATENWTPAIEGTKKQNSSVSLIMEFEGGKFRAKRRTFNFTNQSNMKTTGAPDRKGSDRAALSESWEVFTQSNSELPWDMSRAVATDLKGDIWICTDNGIVKISDGKWQHFNSGNTIISATQYNKAQTESVRDMEVDQKDNKWFVIGYDVYRYDNHVWTRFDSLNSPINWARKIVVDPKGDILFTSWEGVAKFDGSKWSVMNRKNSKLPSDRVLGVFVDSRDRTWIGTFEGNLVIEKGKTTALNDKSSPLSKAYISKMWEDKKGNLWFSLYNEKGTAAGMYILFADGKWERLWNDNPAMFAGNSINDFFLDEGKNILWLSQNNVGIIRYDIAGKKTEIYTTENSNVPSVNIERITKDRDGAIWAATFAGIIKTALK